MLTIKPDEIHVWLAFPDELHDAKLLTSYEQLMTPEEKDRYLNFIFVKDRHQYRVTRALVRTTLSHYIAVHPADWRFGKNKYGKPEIANTETKGLLHFNISHTKGLIICGVVREHAIGVDVENIDHRNAVSNIAKRFFSNREVMDIEALPEKRQKDSLLCYWTLKEAYIKARGMGLSIPLDKFSIHFTDYESFSISFDSDLNDQPNQWQFRLFKPTDNHYLAIAVRAGVERLCKITFMKTEPLLQHELFLF